VAGAQISPTYRAIAGPESGCEGKCFYAHPCTGVVWGSKHAFLGSRVRYAVLPTKTSLRFIQFIGSSLSFLSACSQVSTTSLVNPSFLLIIVAFILSVVSLSLIARSHLVLISLSVSIFSCITLSHLRTQMRYADSEMMIWRSQVGPWSVFRLCCGLFPSLSFGCTFMQPHPRIIPRSISGQGVFRCGHRFCARRHISCVFSCVRMWFIDSVVLHVVHISLSSLPGIGLQYFPIM